MAAIYGGFNLISAIGINTVTICPQASSVKLDANAIDATMFIRICCQSADNTSSLCSLDIRRNYQKPYNHTIYR